MAIVVELHVAGTGRDEADLLDQRVGETMEAMGGPPAGLMVHVGRPSADGLLITDVWRSEPEMRSFLDDVLLPRIAELGLKAGEPTISALWQFGRP